MLRPEPAPGLSDFIYLTSRLFWVDTSLEQSVFITITVCVSVLKSVYYALPVLSSFLVED